ncbi:hypothetical protein [Roseovarius autotrophicus]|uniref:hypothetical protein n=1 Tax=Roseovarius autotrophicus TaxID=2824121 RepID=UPI0019FA09B3|nr:hypothetical protein [Roseovarius autotrophicus]MBE0454792.1 hypothetical protein [Roseovarius sp.]
MRGIDSRALVALTAARRDREASRFRTVLDDEARLRAALARLDMQAAAARALPEQAVSGLREIGADLSWQGWVARSRAALNSELALTLARKEQALPPLRRAFGKAETARVLAARHRASRHQDIEAREALRLDHLTLLRLARARDHMS